MKYSFAYYTWTLLLACILNLITLTDASAAQTLIKNSSLPANGRQETILNIQAFGRYAMMSKSDQGTALRYINKMSGPSAIMGEAGVKDGRIDAFLDIGEYKIVTYADDKGSGDVNLMAKPFTEVNGQAPQLVEHKLVSDQLNDFEQRSYWIHIESRETVILEAAGRSLGDLRLWQDGNWLLDVQPQRQTIEPEIGKPLTVQRISADLNPGLYLLVAYGGAPLDWAETATEQPFHLRMGIPEIAGNGVDHKVTSPFGYDRWLVPASTDYYRLELKKNSPASINVARFDKNYSFSSTGRSRKITRESRLPVAEVHTRKGNKSRREVVTITATAGQPYIFQRFSAVRRHIIKDSGTYWVSTLHSGYGEDSVDATSILTKRYSKESYVDSRTIAIDSENGWQRRFNILDTLTLYFEVEHQGNYRVEANGIQGEYRFEPFTTFRGNNYRTPKARDLGSDWALDRGFYVLTVIPDRDARGVATLSVYADGRKPAGNSPAHISSRYKSVKVSNRERYTVYLNQQPGVTSGIMVRRYPIDLSQPMPLTLNPGESVFLNVRIPSKGELVTQAEDGSLLTLRLKKSNSNDFVVAKPDSKNYEVDFGRYDLSIKNENDTAQNYQLQFSDASKLASTPLPAFNQNLVRRPDFPELTAQTPRYLDLKKRQWVAFNVIVKEPGLYKLESTGLLETRGNIRTRVITQLDQQAANGVGRNFLIQQYLREGDYQLALAPEGDTQGHLGVQLAKTSLINGGKIENNIAARYSLPSGEGLYYEFEITQPGRYQLLSFGTNGFFNARLEDSDGWPLLKPGIQSNLDLKLHAGNYRLVVLPRALPTRVVTLLKKVENPVELEGHGPFALDLNKQHYQHTWLEPADGETRLPDTWAFELPAPAETVLTLSEGMEADLIPLSDTSQRKKFSKLKPFKQVLAAGSYRIEARASRKNNRFDYSLGFALSELVVGQARSVTAPVDIDISTGRAALVELSSFGQSDVKARLFDADDNLLASNDDRANDWNFNIIQTLPAGRYRLALDAVGESSAQTSIRLSEPKALEQQALSLPAEFSISKPPIHSYTLDLSAQSGVLAVAAESRDSVSLSLEKSDAKGVWHSLASASGSDALLLASIDNKNNPGKNYRLKIWSPEQRSAQIRISASLLNTSDTTEAEVQKGLTLPAQDLLSNKLAATRIQLNTAGMFTAPAQLAGALFWAAKNDGQLQKYDGFISSHKNLWLVSLKPSQTLQASRVVLQDQTLQVNVGAGTTAWIDSETTSDAYDLLVAEARVGLPGVGSLKNNRFDARQMGVGLNSSISLANDSSRLKIWNTRIDKTPLPVRLKRHRFKRNTAQSLSTGSQDFTLPAKASLNFGLNAKLQDIRFNLPKGVAAVLMKKSEILRSFWADRRDQNYQIWSDADRLLIFNTAAKDHALNIKLDDVETTASLSSGKLFKRHFPHSGIFSLALDKDNYQGDVVGFGNSVELLIQNSEGRISRGQQAPLNGDSVINITHGVGLVALWLNNDNNFVGDAPGKNRPLPNQVKLQDEHQSIEFQRDKAGFISLHSATPVIARIQRNGLPDNLRVYATGVKTTLFLPAGKSQLQLQSTSAQDLQGVIRLSEVSQLELQEGLGEKVSLLPGDTRVYHFSVAAPRDIGIGVQSSVDVSRAYLFNQKGEALGQGVSQKHKLEKGLYYLMVELPPEASSGVELRPAIVGLKGQDTGASKEIMQDYQQYSSPEAL